MANYAKLAATAQRLIEKNGRAVTLSRRGEIVSDNNKPWRGNTVPSEFPDVPCIGVLLGLKGVDQPDGTRKMQQNGLIAVKSARLFSLTAIAITAPGSGYAAADVIKIAGDTGDIAAAISVLTVDGMGGILTASITTGGFYASKPTAPSATTADSPSVGTGATITGTFTLGEIDLTEYDSLTEEDGTVWELESVELVKPGDVGLLYKLVMG